MTGWWDRRSERKDREWWDRWHREHRWDALGLYNAERHRGLVHTPEWDAWMAEEQAAFDDEMGHAGNGFPIRLDPAP